ncbi:MAG: CapA family protein, partial [Gammaproteobacteria bacterium]
LIQTIESLTAAGIGFAGAGSNAEEAQHPFIYSLPSGQRLLVFSWAARDSGVFPHWQAGEMRPGVNLLPDYSEETARRMVNQVSSYRRQGDITIASIHWGRNWVREIPANHRKLARHLIKYAGVDLVHGHSSHHPLGMETYRGKLIMYGCGDLINDYEGHPNYRPLKNYLGALYFVDLDAGTGNIKGLIWHAIQRRRFRLETPSQEDIAWLSHQIRLFKTSL